MYAIQITGKDTGAVFVLDSRYATKAEAEHAVHKIAENNKGSRTERAVIEVED